MSDNKPVGDERVTDGRAEGLDEPGATRASEPSTTDLGTTDPGSTEPGSTGLGSTGLGTTGATQDTGQELVPHDSDATTVDRTEDDHRQEHRPARPEMNKQTRIGAAWVAVAVGFVVLVLLLIFILQNLDPVTVRYFGADGSMPLGVLLLFAAAGGAFVVIVLGFARMLQLRWLARRDRRAAHH